MLFESTFPESENERDSETLSEIVHDLLGCGIVLVN